MRVHLTLGADLLEAGAMTEAGCLPLPPGGFNVISRVLTVRRQEGARQRERSGGAARLAWKVLDRAPAKNRGSFLGPGDRHSPRASGRNTAP